MFLPNLANIGHFPALAITAVEILEELGLEPKGSSDETENGNSCDGPGTVDGPPFDLEVPDIPSDDLFKVPTPEDLLTAGYAGFAVGCLAVMFTPVTFSLFISGVIGCAFSAGMDLVF